MVGSLTDFKLQSYFESALSAVKSQFGNLKQRFDSITSGLFTSGSENDQKMRPECFMVPYYEEPRHMRNMSPWNHLSRLERDLFDLGRQMTSWDRDFNSFSNIVPGMLCREDFFSPTVESHSLDENSGKYTMNIPLGRNLSPNDVKVSLKDHIMTIETHKEQRSEDGRSRSYQEFTRKFTLPENVRDEEVKSMLTPEGYLKIEAPLPQGELPEPPKPKEIPIQYT